MLTKVLRTEEIPTVLSARVLGERYAIRIAETPRQIAEALRLRHEVFNLELGGKVDAPGAIEFDEFDARCKHLVVLCRQTGRVVGTYRLLTLETAGTYDAFYSSGEFTTETLPEALLKNGIEIGRACIAREHRNTKVLFLLWKGLLEFLKASNKRFFFGCCSIFTGDERAGAAAYAELTPYLSTRYRLQPRRDAIDVSVNNEGVHVRLPSLFEMYLRLGAEVCGPPMIDRAFGTIDFFVVFDVQRMNEKYRRMFAR